MNLEELAVIKAVRQVFSNKKYLLLGCAAFVSSAALFFFLPVLLIPGNSVELQASIYDATSWIVLLVFAALAAIVVPLQVFAIARKISGRKRSTGAGFSSLASVFAAGMFSIKACPVCLAVIFGFLGFPAILFLLEHQRELSLLAIAIAGISVQLTSKSIVEHCEACKV